MKNLKCPKCGKEMEKGMILDHGDGFYHRQNSWAEEKGGFFKSAKNKRQIETYRCKSCGYLESYAK